MEDLIVTIWERKVKKTENVYEWEFNHIENGYVEEMQTPTSVTETQKNSWAGGQWRKQKGVLIEGYHLKKVS